MSDIWRTCKSTGCVSFRSQRQMWLSALEYFSRIHTIRHVRPETDSKATESLFAPPARDQYLQASFDVNNKPEAERVGCRRLGSLCRQHAPTLCSPVKAQATQRESRGTSILEPMSEEQLARTTEHRGHYRFKYLPRINSVFLLFPVTKTRSNSRQNISRKYFLRCLRTDCGGERIYSDVERTLTTCTMGHIF